MSKKDILIGLLIVLVVGMVLSSFASSFPDGLEWVAEKLGFLEKGEGEPIIHSPVPDYTFPFVSAGSIWATSLSGLLGILIVFIVAIILGKLLILRR